MAKALSTFTLEPSAILDNRPSPHNCNPGGFTFAMTHTNSPSAKCGQAGPRQIDSLGKGCHLFCYITADLGHTGEGLGT